MSRFIQLNKLVLSTGLFLMFWTCGPKVELPTIPEDQLVLVLCDVHIMEGALQNRPSLKKDSIAKIYYDQVYQKHNITENDFLISLERLEANPKLMSKVYGEVLVRLDTMDQISSKDKYKKK